MTLKPTSLPFFDNADQTGVVRVDIDLVITSDRHADFILPRQIRFAVKRFGFTRNRLAFPINPDLEIGTGCGAEIDGDIFGCLTNLFVDGVGDGRRRRHDVPANVATRGQRRHQRRIDSPHRFAQVFLNHAVVLNRLPSRDTDGAVSKLIGHRVEVEVLLLSRAATGQGDPDHEAVRFAEPFTASLFAQISIVLLIGSVKLQQLQIVLAERIDRRIF